MLGMGRKKKKLLPEPRPADCADCINPDCPALFTNPHGFEIRAHESDLYDLSINLIERLDFSSRPCERFQPRPEPAPAEKRARRKSARLESRLARLDREAEELGRGLVSINEQARRLDLSLARTEESVAGVKSEITAFDRKFEADTLSTALKRLDLFSSELEELRRRAADPDQLASISAELDELRDAALDRSRIDESAEKLRGLSRDAASQREELERLSSRLTAMTHDLAERESVDRLASELDELKAQAADRSALEGLRAETAELRSRALEPRLLDELVEKLDELGARSVDRDLLEDALARLDEVRARSIDRELLDEVHDRIEDLRSEGRARVEELSARLEALRGSSAERTQIEELSRELGAVRTEAAGRDDLSRLASELKALDGRAAGRESVRKLALELESLRERTADRERLASLGEAVDKLQKNYLDRERGEKLLALITQVTDRQDRLEQDRDRLDRDLAAKSAELLAAVNDLRERLAEPGVADQEPSATELELSNAIRELERKLEQVERGLSAKSLTSADKAEIAALAGPSSSEGLDKLFSRLSTLETEHQELKRQIRKAFENLTEHPLRDLNMLKEKIRFLEQSHRRQVQPASPPPPRPSRAAPAGERIQALAERFRKSVGFRSFIILVVLTALAGAVGVAAAWQWIGSGSEMEEPAFVESSLEFVGEGDNIVYDASVTPLLAPTLDVVSERLQLEDGKADISGYAPGALHAYLYLNNEEAGYCPVEKQGFYFARVPLRYGVNVIQVKSVDDQGNEANSMASMIERMSSRSASLKSVRALNRMRGPRELPMIALTFDAGSTDRRAREILDTLREKGVITTIFLTGQFIERYPEVVKIIVADGHEVGNHTYSHPHLTTFDQNRRHHTAAGINRRRLQQELLVTKQLFEDFTGERMSPWWRAPYGEHNEEIRGWAEEVGFKHVDWTRTPQNLDVLDWVNDPKSRFYLDAQGLYRRLVGLDTGESGQGNGSIVLMHLGTDRRHEFLDQVLGKAIDELRKKGYELVTVSRMFSL